MSEHSAIEWTDATWNPVRGCTKVSPGCKHCYAETFAERFRGVPCHPFEQGFDLRLVPEKLEVPLKWRIPKRIFVNSMSDLFHEDIPTEYIAKVGRVMQDAPWHTYQVLTKRHDRLHELLSGDLKWMSTLRHVWFGVSVEDREHGLPRVESLRRTPAHVRFRQCEGAGVPFFFKQWGGVRKNKAGRHLNGRTYDALPPHRSPRGIAQIPPGV
jgi:protein gp37